MRDLRRALFLPVLLIAFQLVAGTGCSTKKMLFVYTGDTLPTENDGWKKAYGVYEAIAAKAEKGMLHIADRSTSGESAIFYTKEWRQEPGFINVAEFMLKVISAGGDPTTYYPYFPAGYVGLFIGTSDGAFNMVYTLYPDKILSSCAETLSPGKKEYRIGGIYRFDTTSQFNRYKAVIEDGVASLYINDVLALRQSAGKGMYDLNGIEFGAGSSQGTGEAYIDEVRAYQVKVKH